MLGCHCCRKNSFGHLGIPVKTGIDQVIRCWCNLTKGIISRNIWIDENARVGMKKIHMYVIKNELLVKDNIVLHISYIICFDRYHYILYRHWMKYAHLYLCRKIWDALSGEELHSFAHKHIVKTVDFSADSENLLTGSNEKMLRIFDLNKLDAGT